MLPRSLYIYTLLLCSSAIAPPNFERYYYDEQLREKRGVGSNDCGIRGKLWNPNDSETEETSLGEFPWVVGVMNTDSKIIDGQYSFMCEGSVIRKDVVLTSAVCAKGAQQLNKIRVFGGLYNRSMLTEDPYQEREIKKVVIHENFGDQPNYENSIGLFFLKKPFELSKNISPICLPSGTVKLDMTKCLATGWGSSTYNPDIKSKLTKTYLNSEERKLCEQKISELVKKKYNIHESYFCVRFRIGSLGYGDDGTPFMCPTIDEPNHYVQTGLIALSFTTNPRLLLVTSVEYMLPWINHLLSENKPTSSSEPL